MRSMVTVAAVLACLVLGALAVFQLLLAWGMPLGRFAWGGKHQVLPARLRAGSVVSIAVYALFATVLLARAGLVSTGIPERVVRTAAWGVVISLLLGAGLNLASRSKPERAVMSPASAVLCGLYA